MKFKTNICDRNQNSGFQRGLQTDGKEQRENSSE